jgi:hypothetical protein
MAHETYLKPHDVMLGSLAIQKVDRVDFAEQNTKQTFFGDAAVWPTYNRAEMQNVRVTIHTRDHVSYLAATRHLAGTLTFNFKDAAGQDVQMSWPSLIVVDKSGVGGDGVNAWQIVLEVESADGQSGPWS